MSDLAWQENAGCRGQGVDQYFPSQGNTMPKEIVEGCAACPVRAECLEHALTYEDHGFWAGTSERERRRIRATRRIPVKSYGVEPLRYRGHGTYGGYQRHRRLHEQPCLACLQAAAEHQKETRPSRAKQNPSPGGEHEADRIAAKWIQAKENLEAGRF